MALCPRCKEHHHFTGFIYRTVNTANGKWYVGSRSGCPNDGYIGSGVILKRAIAAHGLAAFDREIIWCCIGDRNDLYCAEEALLVDLNAAGDPASYNVKNKGLGQDPAFAAAFFKGKRLSPESRKRMVQTLIEGGKVRGINNPRAREVINLNTHETFSYARLAAESVGGTDAGISEACVKGYKHRGHYWMTLEDWEKAGRPEFHPRFIGNGKSNWMVVCLSDGTIYENASAAGRAFCITASSINAAIEDQEKSAAGHHWMRWKAWKQAGEPLLEFTPYARAIDRVVRLEDGAAFDNAEVAALETGVSPEGIHQSCQGRTQQARWMYYSAWEAEGCPVRPWKRTKGEKRRVRSVTTGEIWDSISSASKARDCRPGAIHGAITKGKPYKSEIFEFMDE